tara:strand:+ start:320 stop:940 length:621 start_codon:yes stop_codon:yes gene_type:complete
VSISNFTELKTSIADFLNRDDLTSVIPTFIKLAEADMNRKLRHWRMEKRATANLDTRYTALPIDFLEPIRLMLTGTSETRLEMITLSELMDKRASSNTSGTPKFYAMVDGSFEVYPTPDQTYTLEIVYYETIDNLSDQITTNWVLTYHPDVYLYSSLSHSAPYLSEDQRTTVWAQLYQNGVNGINMEDQKSKSGGSGHRMRIRSLG